MFNVGRASLLVLGLARGDLDLVARGLDDRLHQPRRASLYPRSMELVERARAAGALGATISGAGPSVLVWVRAEESTAVAERLEREAAGWRVCWRCRSPRAGRRWRAERGGGAGERQLRAGKGGGWSGVPELCALGPGNRV